MRYTLYRLSKKTHTDEKRPTKETYIHQKRHIDIKRDPQDEQLTHVCDCERVGIAAVCVIQYYRLSKETHKYEKKPVEETYVYRETPAQKSRSNLRADQQT